MGNQGPSEEDKGRSESQQPAENREGQRAKNRASSAITRLKRGQRAALIGASKKRLKQHILISLIAILVIAVIWGVIILVPLWEWLPGVDLFMMVGLLVAFSIAVSRRRSFFGDPDDR